MFVNFLLYDSIYRRVLVNKQNDKFIPFYFFCESDCDIYTMICRIFDEEYRVDISKLILNVEQILKESLLFEHETILLKVFVRSEFFKRLSRILEDKNVVLIDDQFDFQLMLLDFKKWFQNVHDSYLEILLPTF